MLQICCINKYLKQAETLNSQVQFLKKISNNAVEKHSFPYLIIIIRIIPKH